MLLSYSVKVATKDNQTGPNWQQHTAVRCRQDGLCLYLWHEEVWPGAKITQRLASIPLLDWTCCETKKTCCFSPTFFFSTMTQWNTSGGPTPAQLPGMWNIKCTPLRITNLSDQANYYQVAVGQQQSDFSSRRRLAISVLEICSSLMNPIILGVRESSSTALLCSCTQSAEKCVGRLSTNWMRGCLLHGNWSCSLKYSSCVFIFFSSSTCCTVWPWAEPVVVMIKSLRVENALCYFIHVIFFPSLFFWSSLQIVDIDQVVPTSSTDQTVRLWSTQGQYIGRRYCLSLSFLF